MYKNYTGKPGISNLYIHKIWLIMRLTTVILFVSLLQVSASTFAQRITISARKAPLEQILKVIRVQSGYDILFDGKNLSGIRPVDIAVKDVSVSEALNSALANQPLTFVIKGRMVIIEKKEHNLLEKITSYFNKDSTIWVSGRVIGVDGNALVGATVKLLRPDGGAMITSADDEGRFRVLAERSNILTLSYVGYEDMVIRIVKGNLGDLHLKSKTESLQEIQVVIGYGTTTERLNTGNVSVVTSQDIRKQPVTNVLQALQGLVPGLEVQQQNGFSSTPFNLKVRGQNNMATSGNTGVNQNSEPLYIIDGVPIISGVGPSQMNTGINQNSLLGPSNGQSPLFSINPSDIESISVLKDADATAIYGARGANGVILITTKKGWHGQTGIDANVYTGLSLQTKKLDLMNTEQYLAMRKRAFINDGLEPGAGDAYDLTIWDQNRYTDWQKEILGTAHTTDAQLSLSGGSTNTTFRLSGGFNRQTPPFKGDYQEQRGSGSLNLTNNAFNGKLVTTAMVNFSSALSNLPQSDPTSLIFLAPNAPSFFNDKGELDFDGWRATGGLPYNALAFKRTYRANTKNLVSNVTLKYEIIPGLELFSSFGYNYTDQAQLAKSPGGSFDPIYGAGRQTEFGANKSQLWIIEPRITWTKSFEKHHLEVLLGSTIQDGVIEGSRITASGYTSDVFLEDLGAATNFYTFSNYAQTKFGSLYSRISYNYDQKYVINLNGRRDGSSRFASGKQFGNFGAIGAAWIFTAENFAQQLLKVLSSGKIRASYGLVGGDGLGDYQYLSSFKSGSNPYQGTPAYTLDRLGNDQFSWTTNKKAEVGLSLGFLENRVNLEVSLYDNRSGDQLVSYPLASTAGLTTIVTNLPAVVQNSGWEVSLQTQNFNKKSFNWSTTINISQNKNKLLKFPDLEKSSYANKYAIGRSITSLGMNVYAGIDPVTGLYLFKDVNGDGEVDLFGSKDLTYKETAPAYYGGLNNNLSYKNLQFGFLFSFSKQKGVLRLSNYYPGNINANQLVIDKQLSGKPPLENLTTASFRPDLATYFSSDAVWVDASYIRLQNVSLSYNLPDHLVKKANLQYLKLYVQCQNLFTITGYKGNDPSSPGSFSGLPPRKIITTGIQITF